MARQHSTGHIVPKHIYGSVKHTQMNSPMKHIGRLVGL